MSLHDLIDNNAIIASLRVTSKKQALQEISERASAIANLPAREIFDALLQRERLGSTGVGGGIAIPHGKLPRVTHMIGLFARLEKPIDYEALDGEPVDLIFLLLAPEAAGADHLKALSRVARALRDSSLTARLRATKDASGLYLLLTQNPTHHAA